MKNADMPAMPGRVITNGESFVETLRPGAQAVSEGVGNGQPVAYIRYRSDGGVEGPILADQACDIRKREWTPLHPHPDPVRAALVEALKEVSESLGHMGAKHLKSRVDAALRAAGVVL